MKSKSISVVMATLNAGEVLHRALKSVRGQDYNQNKIEIIVADGGSTDRTLEYCKKFKAKVIPENTGSPEAAKAVALREARNELVLEIDCDNVLPNKSWLSTMVNSFQKEPKATACYTWRYHHDPKDKILNRYFSLIGANDPVALFLGRADRQGYIEENWKLLGKARDKGKYFLVKHDLKNMPTLGANGFLINRKTLNLAQVDEKHFFHIDVNWDLINLGKRSYVVVKNDIIHDSGEGIMMFFAKRKRYMEDLYLRDLSNRRYLLYDKTRDKKRIFEYCLYSGTFIGPLIFSIRGYLKRRDPAWFLHPIVCFVFLLIYGLTVINWQSWNTLGIVLRKLKLIS